MKKTTSILLLPFSIIYGIILHLRNKFYDWNIFQSTSFNFPVISVGNLSLGGTGKTPHIEYLIRLLQNDHKIATLSRGYKRKTKGFLFSTNKSTALDIGDEPLQYKLKFNNIKVAVDEKRVHGIKRIKEIYPETNLILLDDAYQHRAIKPGLNILITEYDNLYSNDSIIPSGRLRECKSGSKRADIIIVSKTKQNLSLTDKSKVINELKPTSHQKVYFSYIKYREITPFTISAKNIANNITNDYSVLVLTGIAKPKPFLDSISNQYESIEHIQFSDHHQFKNSDVSQIINTFDKITTNNKFIISTEKDIMRLSLPEILNKLDHIPIFYIPIEVCFHGEDKKEFDNQIITYVTKNTRN